MVQAAMPSEQALNKIFEDEVILVARTLWPSAAYGGSTIEDGHERDGFFVTEDVVHVVEATVSRSLSYVHDKCTKLSRLARQLRIRYPEHALRSWIVTKEEPTADQRLEAKKHINITILSFEQFRSKLVNAGRYLENRTHYPFGSARNLETGKPVDTKYKYTTLTIRSPNDNHTHPVNEIATDLASRSHSIVLLGDYGAGKSMTIRQVFLTLSERYKLNKARTFPILLNLRDHQGQVEPQEALERHARRIGHDPAGDLVRAWRSGYATILLDGFDELAALGWSEKSKRLKDIRYRSMELIRRFINESKVQGGIMITGRLHYFDSRPELADSLGLDSSFKVFSIDDFSEDQVKDYLEEHGWMQGIPDWLPSRPLLLSYLLVKGLLAEVLSLGTGLSAASGWNKLLDAVCQREASIEAGIDGSTLRRVIERLGTRARNKPSGMGPLSPTELINAFTEVCGYAPDDRALVLLQRLPGLGTAEGDDSARVFVDQDLAETAKAGDVYSFLCDPYESRALLSEVVVGLDNLGCSVVAYRSAHFSEGTYIAALESAQRAGGILQLDLLRSMYAAGLALTKRSFVFENLWIAGWFFHGESPDFSLLTIRNSVVGELHVGGMTQQTCLPSFQHCLIATVIGPKDRLSLPQERFLDCEISEIIPIGFNTAQLMQIEIPLGARVMLTILEKIFLQPGRGRSEGALFRGLDSRSQSYVDICLDILRSHQVVFLSRKGDDKVWHPVRSRVGEVKALLLHPDPQKYQILQEAWSASS